MKHIFVKLSKSTKHNRVVASDGSLCGFSGHRDGELIAKKRKLLEEEGVTFVEDKVSPDRINVLHEY